MSINTWGETELHNYFPDVFKEHIKNGSKIFQVTQEVPYTINTWAKQAMNPRDFHAILPVWAEVQLNGSMTRYMINNEETLRNVSSLSASTLLEWHQDAHWNKHRMTGIELVVHDINDITEYLTPLDYPKDITNTVETLVNWLM